jgi:rhodanese-related sulfurtransferase
MFSASGRISANHLWARFTSYSRQGLPAIMDYHKFEQCRSNGKTLIVDVREAVELTEKGSVPGTLNLPLGNIASAFALSKEDFVKCHGVEKPNPDDQIVMFCQIGIRSNSAAEILRSKFGFSNVANYKGSYMDWSKNENNG